MSAEKLADTVLSRDGYFAIATNDYTQTMVSGSWNCLVKQWWLSRNFEGIHETAPETIEPSDLLRGTGRAGHLRYVLDFRFPTAKEMPQTWNTSLLTNANDLSLRSLALYAYGARSRANPAWPPSVQKDAIRDFVGKNMSPERLAVYERVLQVGLGSGWQSAFKPSSTGVV